MGSFVVFIVVLCAGTSSSLAAAAIHVLPSLATSDHLVVATSLDRARQAWTDHARVLQAHFTELALLTPSSVGNTHGSERSRRRPMAAQQAANTTSVTTTTVVATTSTTTPAPLICASDPAYIRDAQLLQRDCPNVITTTVNAIYAADETNTTTIDTARTACQSSCLKRLVDFIEAYPRCLVASVINAPALLRLQCAFNAQGDLCAVNVQRLTTKCSNYLTNTTCFGRAACAWNNATGVCATNTTTAFLDSVCSVRGAVASSSPATSVFGTSADSSLGIQTLLTTATCVEHYIATFARLKVFNADLIVNRDTMCAAVPIPTTPSTSTQQLGVSSLSGVAYCQIVLGNLTNGTVSLPSSAYYRTAVLDDATVSTIPGFVDFYNVACGTIAAQTCLKKLVIVSAAAQTLSAELSFIACLDTTTFDATKRKACLSTLATRLRGVDAFQALYELPCATNRSCTVPSLVDDATAASGINGSCFVPYVKYFASTTQQLNSSAMRCLQSTNASVTVVTTTVAGTTTTTAESTTTTTVTTTLPPTTTAAANGTTTSATASTTTAAPTAASTCSVGCGTTLSNFFASAEMSCCSYVIGRLVSNAALLNASTLSDGRIPSVSITSGNNVTLFSFADLSASSGSSGNTTATNQSTTAANATTTSAATTPTTTTALATTTLAPGAAALPAFALALTDRLFPAAAGNCSSTVGANRYKLFAPCVSATIQRRLSTTIAFDVLKNSSTLTERIRRALQSDVAAAIGVLPEYITGDSLEADASGRTVTVLANVSTSSVNTTKLVGAVYVFTVAAESTAATAAAAVQLDKQISTRTLTTTTTALIVSAAVCGGCADVATGSSVAVGIASAAVSMGWAAMVVASFAMFFAL